MNAEAKKNLSVRDLLPCPYFLPSTVQSSFCMSTRVLLPSPRPPRKRRGRDSETGTGRKEGTKRERGGGEGEHHFLFLPPLIFLPPSVRHIFFCEGKRKRERKRRKRKRKSNVGLRGGGGGRDGGGERKPAFLCSFLSPASRPQTPTFFSSLGEGREGTREA